MKSKYKDILKLFISKFLNFLRLSEKYQILVMQILRFLIVGFFATVIDIGLLYIFKEVCDISLIISNTMSFTVSVIFNYFASIKFVFNVSKKHSAKRNFFFFVLFSTIGLMLNDLFLLFGVNILNIYYILSKILATIIVMIFNFITRKKFLEK